MAPALYMISAALLLLLVLRRERFIPAVLLGFDAGAVVVFAENFEPGWFGYVVAINGLGIVCMQLAKVARGRAAAIEQTRAELEAKKREAEERRATLDEQEERLEEGLEAQKELYQAARSLAYVLSTDMFLTEARAVIERFFHFRSAWLIRFDDDDGIQVSELRGGKVEGLGPFQSDFVVGRRDVREVEYVQEHSVPAPEQEAPSGEIPTSRSGALVTIPLIHQEQVWGNLVLIDVRPSRLLSRAEQPDQMEILGSLQHQFALSLNRVLLYDETERLSRTDPLTNVSKRWYFMQRLHEEVERCMRRNSVISVIMVDIDHFKLFNDNYGHLAGDQALRRTAGLLGKSLRIGDLACRYGGEEFLLALPATQKDKAYHVAERIRSEMGRLQFDFGEDRPSIAASLGVAMFPADDADIEGVIEKADRMLYRAKWFGRNCTCIYDPAEDDSRPGGAGQ